LPLVGIVGCPFAHLLAFLAAARALFALGPESLSHVATDTVLDLLEPRVVRFELIDVRLAVCTHQGERPVVRGAVDGEEAELEVAHPHRVRDLEDLLLPRVVGLKLPEQRPVLARVAVGAKHLEPAGGGAVVLEVGEHDGVEQDVLDHRDRDPLLLNVALPASGDAR